jgi:hypothetical protein
VEEPLPGGSPHSSASGRLEEEERLRGLSPQSGIVARETFERAVVEVPSRMFGERGSVMLDEALRIKSALWRTPALSDRSCVLGLIKLIDEAGIRGFRTIDSGSFADEVIAEWQSATTGRSRLRFQVGMNLTPEYRLFVERFVSEAISLGAADREELLAFCNRALQRCS